MIPSAIDPLARKTSASATGDAARVGVRFAVDTPAERLALARVDPPPPTDPALG